MTFTGVDNRGALQFTPKELADHDREVRRETRIEDCKTLCTGCALELPLVTINGILHHTTNAGARTPYVACDAPAIRSLLDGQEEL